VVATTKRTVLFACDRDAVRRELGVALGKTLGAGFVVELTSSPELPFALARVQPDLVLLDVAAPVPAVKVLAKIVTDARSDCPIVLLSEEPEPSLSELATRSHAAGYVLGSPGTPDLAERIDPFLVAPPTESAGAPPALPIDLVAFARKSTRRAFIAGSSFPFLVGSMPRMRSRTEHTLGLLDDDDLDAPLPPSGPSRDGAKTEAMAWAIRKVTPGPTSIIKVGRTAGNDLVIEHRTMSKTHALFRVEDAGMTLQDAGSRNGTWTGGQLLAPNGAASRVLSTGDGVRFGDLEFTFTNAAGCWDMLRLHTK
jgi:CheY-like chemotaxis protein